MKYLAVFGLLFLTACTGPSLTNDEAIAIEKKCLDNGMQPRVYHYLFSGIIQSVDCEFVGKNND